MAGREDAGREGEVAREPAGWPAPGAAGRFVRVMTRGHSLEAIGAVRSARGGRRVLVQAAPVAGAAPERPDGDRAAVADWAEDLARRHGLVWRRVGRDVLFDRPTPE